MSVARAKYKQSRAYVAATAVSAFLMLLGALAVRDHSVRASDTGTVGSVDLTNANAPGVVRLPVQTPKPHTRTKAS